MKTTVQAIWNDVVLAESDATVIVEGNHYFPAASIHSQYFQPVDARSICPWKGQAHYFDIEVDGQRNEQAAWTYPHPSWLAKRIKDRIAFWRGVQVVTKRDSNPALDLRHTSQSANMPVSR